MSHSAAKVRDVGVPVRSVTHVMLFAGHDAADRPCLYATMGQVGAPLFIAQIDLQTGHCHKYLADVPRADEAVSAHWSKRWGCLFAGSCYAGHLHRFDPRIGKFESLGAINAKTPGAACFPCGISEHPDGRLYIGSYGHCDLTRYDPATRQFENFGRMDETDMYLYPLCGSDGSVAALVKMTHPHVIAFDPKTGKHVIVGPVADVDKRQGRVELIKGADGRLYIKTHEGDFRVDGMQAVKVDQAPPAMTAPALPDGSTFRFLDGHVFEYRQLEITSPGGDKRVLQLDWQGDGTHLWMCHVGPDGHVYGSSMLPEHLFRCDTKTEQCTDLGTCSVSGGEAYSMANIDGKVYIGSYPAARLSVYDPSKPLRFGTEIGANPRDLGRLDDVAFRPRAMVAGPAGKVWVGSIPDYGMWGGTLAWYDPKTSAFGSHRHIYQDCCPYAMSYLAELDLLAVGFAVEGGTGTQPKVQRTGLVLWDPNKDCEVWRGDFGVAVNTCFELCAIGDGKAYAVILPADKGERPTLFLLDFKTKRVLARHRLEDPPHGWAPENCPTLFVHRGYVYGATYRGVYRAPLGTTDVQVYWLSGGENHDEGPTGTGALVGDRWYFPRLHRLRCLELPHA